MKDLRPRVLHIIKVKGVSGAENHLLTLLPELNGEYRINLIFLVEPRSPMTEFAREFKNRGIDVTRIVINHHMDFSMIWKIYHLIRKIRPHIVHTHLLHADLYGAWAATMSETEILVSTKHGYDEYDRTSAFYRLNAFSSKWLSRVITISDALQPKVASAEGISRSKMTTVHYGLDGEPYASRGEKRPIRSELNIKNDVCLIGTVGRLVPVKGYEILLEAMAGMDMDCRLLIMGDGPLRDSLETMSRDLGLADRVMFLGFIPDVSPILSQLDLFVLPTLGEGFGLVLLEAMAHRLPIISTNTMAIPEIVAHGETGLLVPPRDVKSLRRAVGSLVSSPETRASMGRKGWNKLKNDFSVESMVRKTGDLYGELLGHARRKHS